MKNLRFAFIYIVLTVWACTPQNRLRIIDKNFSEQVETIQNFSLTFNQDLMPDSLVGNWDTSSYIAFKPKIKGQFRWTTPNTLTFSPSEGLKPATAYAASFTPKLLQYAKVKIGLPDAFSFETPPLQLQNVLAYWKIPAGDNPEPQAFITLSFNYAVSSEAVKKLLNAKVDGKPFAVESPSPSTNTSLVFRLIGNLPFTKGELEGSLEILPGLVCQNGSQPMAEKTERNFLVPDITKVEILASEALFEGGEGLVRITASQPLVAEGVRTYISISPQIEYDVEMTENGLVLRGAFRSGQQYDLVIKAGAKGVLGKTLGQDYTSQLSFGEQQPYLAFTDKNAMYLGLKGNRNLGVKIISIPKVKVSVFKVFENNIMHYLRSGQQWDYEYENDQYHEIVGYPFDENYGKEIFSKEIATSGLSKQGDKYLLNIDPVELGLADDLKGIYVVKVASTDKRWLADSRMFSLTDIGLIVRKGPEQMMVFANSVRTAKPLPGVAIKFVSRNNQVVYTAATNSKGVVEIANMKKTIPGFSIDMVTAHLDEDFNCMVFNENFVETSRWDVGGKRTQHIPYDAFIYGQRNLYRPGDSAHFNVVVRGFSWEKASGLPVKLVVTYPSGQDFATFRKITNAEGSAALSFAIPATAMTGIYTLNAFSGNDVMLSSARFGVEEFMPDRISVLANLNKAAFALKETVTVNVQATSLYGPPAANRRTECELSLNILNFSSKQFPEFYFDLHYPNYINFDPQVTETTTDAKGMASLGFELPDFYGAGAFSGKIYTTVFDENGRPVNRVNKFDYYTQDVFIGIKGDDDWVDTRKPVTINLAAVDVQGKAASKASARVEVVYATYETVLTKYGDRYSYESREKLVPITERTLSFVKGASTLVFNPVTSGTYYVRAYLPGSSNYVQKAIWAYGYGDSRANSFEVDREGEVSIESDKDNYQLGENAHLLFKTPFNGTLLLTVERDKVLEYHYLQTKDRAVAYDLKLSGNHVPNVYVSATLIRPMDNASLPLTVAHGYKSLGIEDPATKLSVDIAVSAKSRSRTKQTISVKTAPRAELTLAVVDEGILQITSYKTPDPFAWFYGKRALETEPFDIYKQLFPELMGQKSSTGGDMAYDMGKRTNPLTNKRVKPAVWWIGPAKADANGNFKTHINIPGFSGALRVMAVAYKDRQFGSNAKTIQVADPVVISTSLPRFLSPGDKLHLPVSLTNTTSKKSNAKVTLKLSGPLSIEGSKTVDIKLNANAESVAEFDIITLSQVGMASVQVTVDAMGERFTEDLDITVRPAAGLTKIGESGSLKANSKLKLSSSEPLIKGTGTSFLYLSKNPCGSLVRDYSYLVQYPHGCLEQSVSAVFPQLYFPEILAKIAPKTNIGLMSPEFNIKQAISKIEGLQMYNGGFMYWPGFDESNWWASVYATHFLYEARKAGFDVSKQTTDNAVKYLKARVQDGDYRPHKYFAYREPIYSLYVLALYGAPDYAQMNYFKANPSLLTYESGYLLAAAYAISGDRKSFEQVLPKKGDFTDYNRNTGGDFSSPLRDRAIALMALVEADPENPRVAEMAMILRNLLKKDSWLSTQEASYSFLALGKLARLAKNSNVQAQVLAKGKTVGTLKDEDLVLKNLDLGQGVNIETSGNGFLYYSWEESGVPISGKITEEDVNLKVRRTLYNRFGQPIQGELKAGDLVVVEISLAAQSLAVDNVAITDILPACFEIENPRLTQERGYDWIKNPSVPDYIDMRDDRINLYTSIQTYTQDKKFYYQVRVTAKGTFKQGPVSADAMYDANIRSYNGAGIIVVK